MERNYSREEVARLGLGVGVGGLGDSNTEHKELLLNLDDAFLIGNGIVVVLMQSGFTCLEAGSVRSKNVTNIVLKNVLDMFISGVLYWLVGFSLAFGSGSGPLGAFAGGSLWAGAGVGDPGQPRASLWFFQFTFAATAATIISGAVAERCRFVSYLSYSAVISGLVYPIVSHWAWHDSGWLSTLGFRDFAGSGVVHLVGGACGLTASIFLGPRRGRFVGGQLQHMPGHSVPLTGVGALLLAAGFLGFNGGSQGHITEVGDGAVMSKVAVNTVLAGAGGALTGLLFARVGVTQTPAWAFALPTNAMLAGMVSGCGSVDKQAMWGALLTGAIGALFFLAMHSLLLKLKVDDPLDAAPVHLGAGFWGLLAGPLFSPDGLAYGVSRESLMFLAYNTAGALAILAWSIATSAILFFMLRMAKILRVSEDEELKGLDLSVHHEPGYPMSAWIDSGLSLSSNGFRVPSIPSPHKLNRLDRPPGTPMHCFSERL